MAWLGWWWYLPIVFPEQSRLSLEDQNEVSLLTALTEILDNADSENLSPFDSIPDSELLVSPREGSSVSVGQRCVDGAKIRTTSVGLLIKVLKHRLISGLLLPFSCTGCSASLGHPQNVTSSLQLTHWGPAQAVVE